MYILDNPNSVVVGSTVTFTVTSSSSLPLTVYSVTPNVCQVVTSLVTNISTITTDLVGSCVVVATSTGDAVTEPIEQVVKNFEVVKIPQKIAITNPGNISLVNGNSIIFTVNVKEEYSNRPVVLISDTPLVCSIIPGSTNGVATSTGTCRITATAEETTVFAAASPVSVEFDVMGTEPGEKLITVLVPQSQITAGTITSSYK